MDGDPPGHRGGPRPRGLRRLLPGERALSAALPPIRVIGTAGHVDHGKSTLIRALTGIDPDRLREEQERGMTIDLGFAWATLADGTDVGIVDVPGHQDFIRNMLAGIGGIDAVVLVVALDESVMPQTREHLAILSLLGIDRGVVALTKRDLVDDDWAALVRDETRVALRGTPLERAPFVEVSATKRAGLDELRAAISSVLGAAPERRDTGRPRLPIDRAFTMTGFGTVVTGTLRDGSLAIGDEVAIVPGDRRARIRGLQTHRRAIEVARPGSRVAVNLSGIDKDQLRRGLVLARPGTLAPTSLLSLRLAVLEGVSATVTNDDALKIHVGTDEVMARVSVLETAGIAAGQEGWVQLHLAQPVAAAVGDRLVVRRPSPSETIGGGVVADVSGERGKRRADAVARLERRTAPSPAARLLASFDVARTLDEAAERGGLDTAERAAAIAALLSAGDALAIADAYLSRDSFEALAVKVERMLAMAHRREPLRPGLAREELRAVASLAPKRWQAVLARLVAEGRVIERGTSLALPAHRPTLSALQEASWQRARAALAAAPLQPPAPSALEIEYGIDRALLVALADRGDLVRIGTDAVFLPDAVASFATRVIDELASATSITVARARDLTGSSRKHVLPLLGFLDDQGITRRVGDERVLLVGPAEAHERLARAIHKGVPPGE
ncbi:MAG: selenocysteine-specific translation elongation factor [Chloroflexi bacterium]|nr:selenocysteine-specific translation elongation factor [Chloroflexota bacterium]